MGDINTPLTVLDRFEAKLTKKLWTSTLILDQLYLMTPTEILHPTNYRIYITSLSAHGNILPRQPHAKSPLINPKNHTKPNTLDHGRAHENRKVTIESEVTVV